MEDVTEIVVLSVGRRALVRILLLLALQLLLALLLLLLLLLTCLLHLLGQVGDSRVARMAQHVVVGGEERKTGIRCGRLSVERGEIALLTVVFDRGQPTMSPFFERSRSKNTSYKIEITSRLIHYWALPFKRSKGPPFDSIQNFGKKTFHHPRVHRLRGSFAQGLQPARELHTSLTGAPIWFVEQIDFVQSTLLGLTVICFTIQSP